jgi:gas vesicle protein
MSKGNKSAGIIAGILAGAAVGVVLGMLYAPEEGQETRKKLKAKANDIKDQALDEYGKVSEKVKSEYGNLSDKAKENIDKVVSSVKDSFDKYKSTAVAKASDVVHEVETELDALK